MFGVLERDAKQRWIFGGRETCWHTLFIEELFRFAASGEEVLRERSQDLHQLSQTIVFSTPRSTLRSYTWKCRVSFDKFDHLDTTYVRNIEHRYDVDVKGEPLTRQPKPQISTPGPQGAPIVTSGALRNSDWILSLRCWDVQEATGLVLAFCSLDGW